MRLGATTQTQVAVVVAGSVLLAHVLSFLIISLLLRAAPAEPVPAIGPGAATLLGEVYDADPDARPAVLEGAARAGFNLRPLDASEAAACTILDRPGGAYARRPPPGPGEARARAKVAICAPALPDGVQTAFETAAGTWLGVIDSRNTPPRHPPRQEPQFVGLAVLAITVATTVLICVWASRRVTAPLLRLAEEAERVDVDHGGTVPQTGGTRELRLLADAFNRLILRLRGYAADQRRLVAGVSHDLRTPLTRLRLRLDQVADPALQTKLIRDVEAMQLVIDSSLSLIHAQERGASKIDVDVAALLATIVDGYTDTGAAVTYDGPLHRKLHCDPALLTRAIENVVDNALKFAGGAGVSLRLEAGRAIIEVRDDGPGISDDQKTRVFEAFYRGDESRGVTEGTGLGLAITKSLILAHGGTVQLLDAAPSGLIVRMVLPAG